MRIDAGPTNPGSSPVRLDPAGQQRPATTRRPESEGGDRVALSAELQLLKAALEATADAPGVRQDRVERMREKLASGELGRDTVLLADRMIDHLLGR